MYKPPPLQYESDPELYRFYLELQKENGNLEKFGVELAPPPAYANLETNHFKGPYRPKYFGRNPGNDLFKLREKRRLTQQQLAIMTGTTKRTIGKIENCHTEPSVYLAIALAEALQTKVEDIFHLEPLSDIKPSKH
jgi:putative transcriptional regulator